MGISLRSDRRSFLMSTSTSMGIGIGIVLTSILLSVNNSGTVVLADESSPVEYGADVSFPMQHGRISTNYPWLPHNVDPENNPTPDEYKDMPIQPLGDKTNFYQEFMKGCHQYYGKQKSACDQVERDRWDMSLHQPPAMVNYTDMGFKKIRAPEKVWKLIKAFWDTNKGPGKPEQWFTGSTYVNHWVNPTTMISVEDSTLRGGGNKLKQAIWDAAKDTLQEWTGEELTQCSLYGVRIYKEGAMLATHVDRLPLVSSAIINVAQDLDEPWPIEVIGHDGKAHNVTMEPGDMVLYESHSVLHGRPFPLKGRFYANIFIHFEPIGHSLRHHGLQFGDTDVDKSYKEDHKSGRGGHEHRENNGLPVYIQQGTIWEKRWRREHGQVDWEPTESASFTTGTTEAHQAAQDGDIETLKKIAKSDKKKLHQKDENGWTPLHEAARGGHIEVVRFLHENGVNINERTHGKQSALAIAVESLKDAAHPLVAYLVEMGGEL